MSRWEKDRGGDPAMAARNAEEFRKAVARLWRSGLTDHAIALRLNVRGGASVSKVREELGLPRRERCEE